LEPTLTESIFSSASFLCVPVSCWPDSWESKCQKMNRLRPRRRKSAGKQTPIGLESRLKLQLNHQQKVTELGTSDHHRLASNTTVRRANCRPTRTIRVS